MTRHRTLSWFAGEAGSLAKSVSLSASMRPTSVSVLIIAGQLNVTNAVVFTSPALVVASSRTVQCITPAVLMLRHQPGLANRDDQATRPRFLTLPQRFFQRPTMQLTPLQAAQLAVIFPDPLHRSAARPGQYVREQTRTILHRIEELGALLDCTG